MTPVVRVVWEPWADHALPLPAYQTAGSAGADLCANLLPEDRATGFTLDPMRRAVVPTGLRLEIPVGFEAQIRPRSGLAVRFGITLPNTPGTIDSDYRGPLGVALINLGHEPYTIRHGDRIAQMVVAPVVQAVFQVATALSETDRGVGGFGSTGFGSAEARPAGSGPAGSAPAGFGSAGFGSAGFGLAGSAPVKSGPAGRG